MLRKCLRVAGISPLVLLGACGTQRTVTEAEVEPRSRLYENTMGFEFGDFSRRSEFDALRQEGKRSPLAEKNFTAARSRVQEQVFEADASRLGEKNFNAGEGVGEERFFGASTFHGQRAGQGGRSYRDAAKDFGRAAVPGHLRKSADHGAEAYDTAPGRLVEDWRSDSLPPRIIQTPDSDGDLSALQSVDDLRATLRK